jgi:hypothetical protein
MDIKKLRLVTSIIIPPILPNADILVNPARKAIITVLPIGTEDVESLLMQNLKIIVRS